MESERSDLVVVGAGAAGLFAAIWAGRAARAAGRPMRIVALDGARTLGAKILVAGGGRCNVTHDEVSERDYAGSTPPAIRKVLRRFGVAETIRFFAELGVELKREETGKLFPVTDDAHTVLDALLRAARDVGVELRHPARVVAVERSPVGFRVVTADGAIDAPRVVLATGGKSLPKSGSDGAGYAFAVGLGHTIAEPVIPALVPLLLSEGHPLRELSGLTFPAEVRLVGGTGRTLVTFSDSTLCTHVGLSGPSILDISRHWTMARRSDAGAHLEISFLPGATAERLETELTERPAPTPLAWLRGRLPERLLRSVCAGASVDPTANLRQLGKDARRRLVRGLLAAPVEPTGDRGWTHAEVTAGGVPLAELRLEAMESRVTPGLFVIGELCDVDGRIGGYNFQWAWASGFVAGNACGHASRTLPANDGAGSSAA